MFDFFYFLLGFIQGLTEFLPVSSSGHLALIQSLVSNMGKESLLIEITAHFGSLLAIGFYYRKSFYEIKPQDHNFKEIKKVLIPLIISIVPTGIIGLIFKTQITRLFSNPHVIAFGFLFTSFALICTFWFSKIKSKEDQSLDWPTKTGALFIGFSQALALLPGISRSGSTIAAGVIAGLKPKQAAFFSFCSVAPLITAATALSVYRLIMHVEHLTHTDNPLNLSILLLASFFFSWIGLSLVIKFLEKDKFHYFAAYLIPLALFIFLRG